MKDHLICQVGVDSAELVALLLGESEELDQLALGILVSPGPEMIVIKTLLIRFYHKKVLHCWTSCNCSIILQYLEYAYQNQFTWYELLILHVSWFCWKCVKFHRIFLSCYVIDRVISVYLYIHYDILLDFLKSTDRIIHCNLSWNYFNVQFYEYLLPKEKFWTCKYYASRSSHNLFLLRIDIDIIFLSKNLFAIKTRIANEVHK